MHIINIVVMKGEVTSQSVIIATIGMSSIYKGQLVPQLDLCAD